MSAYVCMYMYCYIQKGLSLYAIKIIIVKILIFNNTMQKKGHTVIQQLH